MGQTVPPLINYQGKLVSSNGLPVSTGDYELRFRIYDAATAGNLVWGPQVFNGQTGPGFGPKVPVVQGWFNVMLGPVDTNGVSIATAFAGTNRFMEIQLGTSTPFSPRQQVLSAPFALMAGTVPDGAVTGAKLATGAAAANLAASGAVILSPTDNNSALTSGGYSRISATRLGDGWLSLGTALDLFARQDHTAVWTGSEMIVWGGWNGLLSLGDGVRYNQNANSWTPMSNVGAPVGRAFHSAVWTGTEMIVWGGTVDGTSRTVRNDGGRYRPGSNSWTAISTVGAPNPRYLPSAVWTGTEMLVWGGYNGAYTPSALNDGGLYNPVSNSWRPMTLNGAPAGRLYYTAIWTGTELIIWGGYNGPTFLTDGWRYNPTSDTWAAVTTNGAPTARAYHTAVWTGNEMIVWGGSSSGYLNDGGRYNPATDSWTAISLTAAPAARSRHTAEWTGGEMIVWGGSWSNPGFANDGGRYDPVRNSWTAVTALGAPVGRVFHTSIWTGQNMIICGGQSAGSIIPLGDSWSYNSERTMFLYQKP